MTDDHIEGFHPTFWEMWATFNLFRVLGFLPDDIYVYDTTYGLVGHPAYGKMCAFVQLRTQGKECNVVCGMLPEGMDRETFQKTWNDFSENLPHVPTAVTERVWRESNALRDKAIAVSVLVTKGFRIPMGSD